MEPDEVVTRAVSSAELAQAAQLAALLEVSAAKPGNVGPDHDFGDTSFEDFLRAALAIGPAMGAAGPAGVGATVLRAVEDTRRLVAANANLGIVLLFAPLARAAAGGAGPLRPRLDRVLAELTVEDARAVYRAIRLADPGGLGRVPEQDVRDEPAVTLRQAMALAAERDAIAREYVTGYAITFGIGLPALRRAGERGARPRAAALEAFLHILAGVPDTLIARRRGTAAAAQVSRQAAAVLAQTAPDSPDRAEALARLDAALREGDNALNPGTTADLTAAALFVQLLERGPSGPE